MVALLHIIWFPGKEFEKWANYKYQYGNFPGCMTKQLLWTLFESMTSGECDVNFTSENNSVITRFMWQFLKGSRSRVACLPWFRVHHNCTCIMEPHTLMHDAILVHSPTVNQSDMLFLINWQVLRCAGGQPMRCSIMGVADVKQRFGKKRNKWRWIC